MGKSNWSVLHIWVVGFAILMIVISTIMMVMAYAFPRAEWTAKDIPLGIAGFVIAALVLIWTWLDRNKGTENNKR